MTEMFRRGHSAHKAKVMNSLYGKGDPIPILLEQVETVAHLEGIEPQELLTQLAITIAETALDDGDEEIYNEIDIILNKANGTTPEALFDAKGNNCNDHISGR